MRCINHSRNIKLDGITNFDQHIYLFNNDWSGTDTWQFSEGVEFHAKSDMTFMYFQSSSKIIKLRYNYFS